MDTNEKVLDVLKNSGKAMKGAEIAEAAGSINYEVVCRFGQRLPKVYL